MAPFCHEQYESAKYDNFFAIFHTEQTRYLKMCSELASIISGDCPQGVTVGIKALPQSVPWAWLCVHDEVSA